MALQTAAQIEAMLKATGGETVLCGGVTTYGHFERVPVELGDRAGQGGIGGVMSTTPSLVIADGILTQVGKKKGIDRTITVDGVKWLVSGVMPADEDGGMIRVMLKES